MLLNIRTYCDRRCEKAPKSLLCILQYSLKYHKNFYIIEILIFVILNSTIFKLQIDISFATKHALVLELW